MTDQEATDFLIQVRKDEIALYQKIWKREERIATFWWTTKWFFIIVGLLYSLATSNSLLFLIYVALIVLSAVTWKRD